MTSNLNVKLQNTILLLSNPPIQRWHR